jgi:ATP-dependent DNA helicase 2 subunit 2
VAIQTARPKTVEEVMNLEVGEHEGNRELPRSCFLGGFSSSTQADPPPSIAVSAVMVALDMIQTHKHTKSWSLEIVLITDGK